MGKSATIMQGGVDSIESVAISPPILDQVLTELDSLVAKAYLEAGLSDASRVEVEREMMLTGQIPPILLPVFRPLLQVTFARLKAQIQVGDLTFKDYSPLGIHGGKRARNWWSTRWVDVIRKVEIKRGDVPGGVKIRMCARCGSVMEDLLGQKILRPWMGNTQRTCLCGGFWMVE